MDKELFVQNIKKYCACKNVKPTVACRESGVGSSFINNIEARGQVPSIEKVQMLAQYLCITVSELLGEKKYPALSEDEEKLVGLYQLLNEEGRERLLETADDMVQSKKYKETGALRVDAKEA